MSTRATALRRPGRTAAALAALAALRRAAASRLPRPRLPSRAMRLLLVALALLVALLVAAVAALAPARPGREISIGELLALAANGRVASAQLLDQDHVVSGRLTLGPPRSPGGPFHASYPANDTTTARIIEQLARRAVPVSVRPQHDKAIIRLLTTTVLPILILANLFALLFAGRESGGLGEVEAFGQLDREGTIGGRITFADVAGVDEAQEELAEVVDYLRAPDRYATVGAVPPKGVLLFGPPGCGKTLLARAVAGEAGVPFFSVAGAEFVESLVGVGAARVRDLFAKVRAVAPAIVFLDELDAAGRRRGGMAGGGGEERDQTLNQLLVEMDGFQIAAGIVVIGATNRADILDPALLRPGRFDRHMVIDPPDVEQREAILRLHAVHRPLAPDIDFGVLARQTPGFTGADLANVLNEAALLTIRADRSEIDAPTLSEAVQRVLAGPQRRGHLLTAEERRRVACHEAGHAVAAALLGHSDRLHRVSIVARGRGLGTTALAREDAEAISTAVGLRARLAVALAGRAAEELVLGDASTGAADDLHQATLLAREMTGLHGLSPEVGLSSLLVRDGGRLGAALELGAVSERQWAAFDAAVARLLEEGHAAARALVQRAGEELAGLTERLLAEEALEGRALAALLPPPLPETEARALLSP